MVSRQVIEGRLLQGKDERIGYQITTTPWGSSPTSIVFALYDISADTWVDVTATKAPGAPSVLGDVISLQLIIGLVAGNVYRGNVRFVAGGNTFECYFEIQAEK